MVSEYWLKSAYKGKSMKIPLYTSLLGTIHGPCTEASKEIFQKISKFNRFFFTKNVDNTPVIIVIYVCKVIIHVDSHFLYCI